jgi:hypothetical protein
MNAEAKLAAIWRKHAVYMPVRTVHHWRGKRFVTAKRCVVSGFL